MVEVVGFTDPFSRQFLAGPLISLVNSNQTLSHVWSFLWTFVVNIKHYTLFIAHTVQYR